MIQEEIGSALAVHGLILRGGLVFDRNDSAPVGPNGGVAKSVLLIGHGGAAMWPHFHRWLTGLAAIPGNPLDCWSKKVIGGIAAQAGARAVFPSDRPYLPFQQWAMRAEGLKPSPLGIVMHPRFGLWHAWRGALLFEHEISIHVPREPIHHCDLCDGKPCLNSCPVGAFSGMGYAVDDCVDHVNGTDGTVCLTRGCLARNACPVAAEHRYPADQQAFHMAAFLRARTRR